MKSSTRTVPMAILLAITVAGPLRGDEADAASTATVTNAEEVLRAYQTIQERLTATQQAVERNREEAGIAAARNADAIATRLQAIEQTLAAQRSQDLEAVQSSNRVLLVVAGTFAAMGLAVMFLVGYFQWRAVNRLADVSPFTPAMHPLGPAKALSALNPAGPQLISPGIPQESNLRLLGTLDRLEKRVRELEHAAYEQTRAEEEPASPTAVNSKGNGPVPAAEWSGAAGQESRVTMLLGKGQSLLSLDNAEAALACFNEVLDLNPAHAEALVKKGTALERLGQVEEAAACYDQAIAADPSLTMAYLYKGGLCNRLERFSEALECYEKALRSQQKRQG